MVDSRKLVLFIVLLCGVSVYSDLAFNYYNNSCPQAERVVFETIKNATVKNNLTGAWILRMHFHDCFVEGCDGSLLLDSNSSNTAEKDFAANNPSIRGYDVIDAAKTTLEAQCPGVVSCADILAFAARDGVHLSGGPYWFIRSGRRDGRVSQASRAAQFLPPPTFNITQLKAAFAVKNLTSDELVTLSGGHTIGISHCSSFTNRLYNFTGHNDQDPALNTTYATTLKSTCPSLNSNPNITVPMDSTPLVTDNIYYKEVLQKKGLFTSDSELLNDSGTSAAVSQLAANITLFWQKFVLAMIKMSEIEVKTAPNGEIRLNCHVPN